MSAATSRRAEITAAAPAMSTFMSSIPDAVFRESPPESKVMALPTSATGLPVARRGSHDSLTSCGSSTLPCATPRKRFIPSFLICARGSTWHCRPCTLAMCRASAASARGVMRPAGSLTRSRAALTASAIATPYRAASTMARDGFTGLSSSTRWSLKGFFSFLYRSKT